MSDKAVRAVSEYLERALPGTRVNDAVDFDRHAHSFRLTDASGRMIGLVTVSGEFLDDVPAAEIGERLKTMPLKDALSAAGTTARVIVTTTGLRTESLRTESR
jgi:hypothetical protein